MSASLLWFIGTCLSLPLAWWGGYVIGRRGDSAMRYAAISLAVVSILIWGWLIRHPAVAVHAMPVSALANLEGVGAAPIFMFIVGIAWSAALVSRQRAFVIVGMVMGAGYFLQGGMWMVQQTPVGAFAQGSHDEPTYQSQDYSCVPAACTTALRHLGIESSEAEMAELTQTRAGSGATLIRALDGLNVRLGDEGIVPQLIQPSYEQLVNLPVPMLTPLQYEATRLHMVTILNVEHDCVVVMDPVTGMETLSRERFEGLYRGQVIVFEFD